MAKKPEVTTTFYASGKAVWKSEWYEQLSADRILEEIERIAEMGYGKVDAVTDTTGRMVSF